MIVFRRYAAPLVLCLLVSGLSSGADSHLPSTQEHHEPGLLLFDFTKKESMADWRVVNDNVMGGKSKGGFQAGDARMIFSGSTNTDGGGFSSIRGPLPPMTRLSIADGLRIVIRKPDARDYKIDLRQKGTYRGRSISFRADIKAGSSEAWQEIKIPFSDFSGSWRGYPIREAKLDPATATQIGFYIYDKKDGPFHLEVRSVSTYRD
ncbi:MAG: CIA30 family protein [Verrucomicrobiota bacterium]